MKQITLLLLVLILSVPNAEGAGVKLELLEDFDAGIHKIGVNIQAEVKGGCVVNPTNVKEAFEVLLTRFGFQIAPLDESDLEFAVSIKGFSASESQPCGVMILSMIRQIPKIKMLRLSPGSTSTRYRLWTIENTFTATQDEIQSLLQDQARKDVVDFSRTYKRSGH